MIVERIWTANAYRNYNFLIACPETGEALAIDPLDHQKCLAAAKDKGWQITQILNTHEHHDHTGGNAAVVAATGAKIIAHHKAGKWSAPTHQIEVLRLPVPCDACCAASPHGSHDPRTKRTPMTPPPDLLSTLRLWCATLKSF